MFDTFLRGKRESVCFEKIGKVVRMKKLLIGIIISLFPLGLIAVQKGSNTLVSLESSASFPAADIDNEMLTFGYFKNGFTLEDSTTTCTFSSVFPIGGLVELNGGQLYCTNDLRFENDTFIQTGGFFNANGHALEFGPRVVGASTFYPSTIMNATMTLHNDFYITGSLFIQGDCTVEGRNHRVTMYGPDAYVVIMPGSTLRISDVGVQGIKGMNIHCADDTASIICSNCSLLLEDNFTFEHGFFQVNKEVIVRGSKKLIFKSSVPALIDPISTLIFDIGTTFSYDPIIPSPDLIQFSDASSALYLRGSSLVTTVTGMQLTTGTLIIDGNVNFKSHYQLNDDGSVYTAGIIFGDGVQSTSDMFIKILPSSQMDVIRGWITYQNIVPASLQMYANNSSIMINEGAALYLNTLLDLGEGSLKVDSTTSIIKHSGGQLTGNVQVINY